MSNYVSIFRRKREGLTDYRKRKKAILSGKVLAVVRKSNKNVLVQFVKPDYKGDIVLSSSHSRVLRKLGWKGSLKCTPACYLLGYYAGKKAISSGIKDAILYTGLDPYVNGSRTSAVLKGLIDSGISIPCDTETLPDERRIRGEVIASYASLLQKQDPERYKAVFSGIIKNGIRPEDYPSHFDLVLRKIKGEENE